MGRPEEIALGAQAFIRAVSDFIFVEDAPAPSDVIFGARLRVSGARAAGGGALRAGDGGMGAALGAVFAEGGRLPGRAEAWRTRYPGHYETEWDYLRDVLTGADRARNRRFCGRIRRATPGTTPCAPGR